MSRSRLLPPTLLLLTAVTSCGGSSSTPASAPSQSPSPTAATPSSRDTSPDGIRRLLRDLVKVEEVYYLENESYLPFTGTIPAALQGPWLCTPAGCTSIGTAPAGVKLGVAIMGTTGLCAVAAIPAEDSFILYDSTSKQGFVPPETKAEDMTPACAAEVRRLFGQ